MSWRPTRRRTPILSSLDLQIPAGQRVLVTGPSGSGKSTLLRALAGLLLTAAVGDLEGVALIDGRPIDQASQRPGLLLQDPLAGIVAETVGRDVAFGPENHGLPRKEIWPLVDAALAEVRFGYGHDRLTSALSGGESQRLALAGTLALGGRALLLDEPTSMLDPASEQAVRDAVRRLADAHHPTVVIVEHRLDPWLDFADRLVVLGSEGQIVADGAPLTVLEDKRASLAQLGVWVPGLGPPDLIGVDARLVKPWAPGPDVLVEADQVWLERSSRLSSHRSAPTRALQGVDAVLRAGRALAVTGPSGAGKSSLVTVLAGLRAPTSGRVQSAEALATPRGRQPHRWRSRELAARLAWVPQFPEHGIVARTVRDEVVSAGVACARDPGALGERAEGLLDALGLTALAGASPYHLSGGEQRRLMLAAALAHGPYGVLLDEPTVGQDRLTWRAVVGAAASARAAGSGIAIASHDALAVHALSDDVVRLDQGVMVS